MPTRIPEFTYTSSPMYGYIPSEGAIMPGLTYSQGEDVYFEISLSINGTPLSLADYKLRFIVKKAEEADNIIYQTEITTGLAGAAAGLFSVFIPGSVTRYMWPGTYYFDFVAEGRAMGRIMVVHRGTFNIDISAISPNPTPTLQDGELTAFGDSHPANALRTPAEVTGPDSPDISDF